MVLLTFDDRLKRIHEKDRSELINDALQKRYDEAVISILSQSGANERVPVLDSPLKQYFSELFPISFQTINGENLAKKMMTSKSIKQFVTSIIYDLQCFRYSCNSISNIGVFLFAMAFPHENDTPIEFKKYFVHVIEELFREPFKDEVFFSNSISCEALKLFSDSYSDNIFAEEYKNIQSILLFKATHMLYEEDSQLSKEMKTLLTKSLVPFITDRRIEEQLQFQTERRIDIVSRDVRADFVTNVAAIMLSHDGKLERAALQMLEKVVLTDELEELLPKDEMELLYNMVKNTVRHFQALVYFIRACYVGNMEEIENAFIIVDEVILSNHIHPEEIIIIMDLFLKETTENREQIPLE